MSTNQDIIATQVTVVTKLQEELLHRVKGDAGQTRNLAVALGVSLDKLLTLDSNPR